MSDKTELPPLPEWAKRDDLGGLVPSQIRQELRDYARAAVELAKADQLEAELYDDGSWWWAAAPLPTDSEGGECD